MEKEKQKISVDIKKNEYKIVSRMHHTRLY